MRQYPVVIVGGGPVGLSLSLALARQNIQSLVIEKCSAFDEFPKARYISNRSMEIFRNWKITGSLSKYEVPREHQDFVWGFNLSDKEIFRFQQPSEGPHYLSPTTSTYSDQRSLVKVIFNKINKEGNFYFHKEMTSFEEFDDSVIVKIKNNKTGKEEFVKTKYLIGADGAHSKIRRLLNIACSGPGVLGRYCGIYFKMKLDEVKKFIYFRALDKNLENPRIGGVLLQPYNEKKHLWKLSLRFKKEETENSFTDERCLNEIRKLINDENVFFEFFHKSFWETRIQVADHYNRGRVFLVGDAAHVMPPTGGKGMNIGIQDAHNLAWKLAYVLNYNAPIKLLDSYGEERAPVAKDAIQSIYGVFDKNKKALNDNRVKSSKDDTVFKRIVLKTVRPEDISVELFTYRSAAIISDDIAPPKLKESRFLKATPGMRAPHAILKKGGKEIYILDLFEKEFVLITGENGVEWKRAVKKLVPQLPFPLKCYRIAADGDFEDIDNDVHRKYGLSGGGAVLVRPDGHVAWRSKTKVKDPVRTLQEVLVAIGVLAC